MKNVKELRTKLADVFDGVLAGTVEHKTCFEATNTAGKICTTIKLQLEYFRLRKEKPQIDFLKCK